MHLWLEFRDEALHDYLNNKQLTNEQIKRSLRKGTLNRQLSPVLCGAAYKNKGIEPLLDAIIDYLPSPSDINSNACKQPFAAFVFKVTRDKHDQLNFVRVYQGTLKAGMTVLNTNTGKTERINRLVRVLADKTEAIEFATAGDIIAIPSLKNSRTGHTLSDPGHPVSLEGIEYPEPVIGVAIEAGNNTEQVKLDKALRCILAEDPSLQFNRHSDTGVIPPKINGGWK